MAAIRTLHLNLPVARVETVCSAGHCAEGFSPDFQVALPYRGMFVWQVGRDEVVADPNQVLFVAGGEPYRISRALVEGYQELIITPAPAVLSDVVRADGRELRSHALFRQRRRRAEPQLQAARARFLAWVAGTSETNDLAGEEMVLRLLRATLLEGELPVRPSPSTMRLIRRTKEFLAAQLAMPVRLADAARAAGASPAYLTHVFSRFEGLSLHQYLTGLRLARALADLSHTDDLTVLALDVGFSSHSHFTAAFRRAYGLTPSCFRELTRRQVRPLQPRLTAHIDRARRAS